MSARGLFTIATPVDTASTGPAVDDLRTIVEEMHGSARSP